MRKKRNFILTMTVRQMEMRIKAEAKRVTMSQKKPRMLRNKSKQRKMTKGITSAPHPIPHLPVHKTKIKKTPKSNFINIENITGK